MRAKRKNVCQASAGGTSEALAGNSGPTILKRHTIIVEKVAKKSR